MGLLIKIGEYRRYPDEQEIAKGVFEHDVIETSHEQAPCSPGDSVCRSNERQPTYVGWEEFVTIAGLRTWPNLPSAMPDLKELTESDLEFVNAAWRTYKADHPNAVPGFEQDQDPQLARLFWLNWWITYAVKNCKRPVILYA